MKEIKILIIAIIALLLLNTLSAKAESLDTLCLAPISFAVDDENGTADIYGGKSIDHYLAIIDQTPSTILSSSIIQFPRNVEWCITLECGWGCDRCRAFRSDYAKGAELSFEEAKRLIDLFHEKGVETITISGGEPLNRKDIVAILQYIREKGMSVHLFTNMSTFIKNDGKVSEDKMTAILSNIDLLILSYDDYHERAYLRNHEGSYLQYVVSILQFVASDFPNLKTQVTITVSRLQSEEETLLKSEDIINHIIQSGKAIVDAAKNINDFTLKINRLVYVKGNMLPFQRKFIMGKVEFKAISRTIVQRIEECNRSSNTNVTVGGVERNFKYLLFQPNGTITTNICIDDEDEIRIIGSFRDNIAADPAIFNLIVRAKQHKYKQGDTTQQGTLEESI